VKRSLVAALLSVALSGATVGAVGAAPAPSYSAALTADSSCTLTLKATWKNTTVDTVYGIWYQDEVYRFTTQAPFTGPNGGTLRGRTATMQAGPVAIDTTSHAWRVQVDFYWNGANVGQLNPTVAVPCWIEPTP
jgi:hypothetical protein